MNAMIPQLRRQAWVESPGLGMMFIFITSFGLRLVYVLLAGQIDPFLRENPLHGDAASYDRIARSLLNHTGYSVAPPEPDGFWPPLYPFFLWLVYSIFGYNIFVARVIQVAIGVFVCVLIYILGHKLLTPRQAGLAALGAALYPFHIIFGSWLIAEALFLVLMLLTLLVALILKEHQTYKWAIALGVLVGLGILAKPVTLFFLPFAGLWLLLTLNTKRLRLIALVTFAGLGVVAPWIVRNHYHFGMLSLSTNGGYTFYGANNTDAFGGHIEGFPLPLPGLNIAEQDQEYYRLALEWIRTNPDDFVVLVVKKYRRLLSPLSVASWENDYRLPFSGVLYLVYWAFLGSVVYGIVSLRHRWRDVSILYIPMLGVFLAVFFFYGDVRYTLPMFPAMVLFSAVTVDQIRLKKR